jgi:putative glutathione S-transferase
MGLLVDGKWQDRWYDTGETGGRFVRSDAQFRNWITRDGRPGRAARAASSPSPAATTSTSRSPAPGRTAR